MVRDMDLEGPNPRRLEIVEDGLPLCGGAQLAIDTTLISTLHCDGSACGCQEEERAHLSGVGWEARPARAFRGCSRLGDRGDEIFDLVVRSVKQVVAGIPCSSDGDTPTSHDVLRAFQGPLE